MRISDWSSDVCSSDLLGPPLPGDLGRPILNAQNSGQPVPNPSIASPSPGISQEEQRRLQELEAARTARLFSSTESRSSNNPVSASSTTPPPQPDLTSLGLAPQPATPSAQDQIGRASCRERVGQYV